ncbi:MAG: Lrp/AsnC family transcriptional regulator [Thermoplasmata archaeon]|nr:Lrp/AsnC family transcriptional regulator [Thermoplasmata archaeon]
MKLDFTPAERAVLHGLVRHPTLNDRQLSEVIGVKPSTTTAIRRRLRKKEVFYTKRIPMANRLGYEILVFVFGRIRPGTKEAEMNKLLRWVKKVPGIFFAFMSSDSMCCVGYFKNYSEYRILADAVWEDFGDEGPIDPKSWQSVVFSVERCKLVNFFDYSSPLRHLFGIDEEVKLDKELEAVTEERLSKKEMTVLSGLIAYPESSDKTVAEKVKASRQAVSSMRKRFEDIGILRTLRIVDLAKAGYQMMAIGHLRFQPQAPLSVRWVGVERTVRRTPTMLFVASSSETVAVGLMSDYDELHELKKDFLDYYAKKGFYREDPAVMIFPVSDTKIIKDFDFSGFMDRLVQEER